AGRKVRGFFTIRQKQHDKLHYLLNFSTIGRRGSLPAGRKVRGFFTIRQKQHDKLHYLLNFSTIGRRG
ncbi:hypothetical protein C7D74_33550, partial [Klebsiella pneumoniae]